MKIVTTLAFSGMELSLSWQADPVLLAPLLEADGPSSLADDLVSIAPALAAEMTRQLVLVQQLSVRQFQIQSLEKLQSDLGVATRSTEAKAA